MFLVLRRINRICFVIQTYEACTIISLIVINFGIITLTVLMFDVFRDFKLGSRG